MKQNYWYDEAEKVLRALRLDASDADALKKIDAAYPFDMKSCHPFRQWRLAVENVYPWTKRRRRDDYCQAGRLL